jgi:hypothetical protein
MGGRIFTAGLAALWLLWAGNAVAGQPAGLAFFDPAVKRLPARYAGQDVESAFTAAASVKTDEPRAGESYTDFAARRGAGDGQRVPALEGGALAFAVDLKADDNLAVTYDPAEKRLGLLYRMAFNQIAEGWSWDERASPDSADYYRYDFFPLKTVVQEKGTYTDVLYGETVQVRVIWRYDYFLAFENLYDFYGRVADDDAGFRASLPMGAEEAKPLTEPGRVGVLALFRLKPFYRTESNTFWKATLAKPTDYTLKKRYLVGDLLEVWFYDFESGEILAKVRPAR